MSEFLQKPWFKFMSLLLILASGAAWISVPKSGIWLTLLALLPWVLRLLVGKLPFQRTPFDWVLAIFLITAWVGYWAAYDKTTAWIKVWLIVTAVLLYYSLSTQPRENFTALSLLSFCIGLGVSFYFFLTHDFTNVPGSIAAWWMSNRPAFGWHAIHHGYISGLLVITNLFAAYWVWNTGKSPLNRFTAVAKLFLLLGLGFIFVAFILTMSRGIWAAATCGLGVWLLWKFIISSQYAARTRIKSLFPVFVLAYLSAIILFVYLGPARSNADSGQNDYGSNSRAEVFARGAYFLQDYPFTGAGLNSFPGLYSEYMLSIPYFYFMNSYNMFLDVAVEQGLIGGLTLIFIYIGSIWFVSHAILRARSSELRFISWLSLFALIVTIVHGLFYDYLYFGNITMLVLFPVGFSMMGVRDLRTDGDNAISVSETLLVLNNWNTRIMVMIPVLALFTISAFNINKILSLWYADLGAVQMSRVQLRDFPTNGWDTAKIVPQLEPADASLRSALLYNHHNATANYRLGLISMLRHNYASAIVNLEMAYKEVPDDRGVIKNLGYCYVWLGETDKAKPLLEQIPEARKELDIYVWWWGTQGRQDLAKDASQLISKLDSQGFQP